MVSNFNLTWKAACLEILNYFTERTPNSFIEEREASIVWRFWMGDSKDDKDGRQRQWARRQAAEAQNHVFDRRVFLFIRQIYELTIVSVLANDMDCALFLAKTVSWSFTTMFRVLQPSVRFCTLEALFKLLHRDPPLGQTTSPKAWTTMRSTSCWLSAEMKSCSEDSTIWIMLKHVRQEEKEVMRNGDWHLKMWSVRYSSLLARVLRRWDSWLYKACRGSWKENTRQQQGNLMR